MQTTKQKLVLHNNAATSPNVIHINDCCQLLHNMKYRFLNNWISTIHIFYFFFVFVVFGHLVQNLWFDDLKKMNLSSSASYDSDDNEEISRLKENKAKPLHRKQKYRKEWETMSEFKNWLTKDEKSIFNAKCRIWSKTLTCELTTIKRHAKTMKHKELQSNRSQKQKAVINRFVQSKGKPDLHFILVLFIKNFP